MGTTNTRFESPPPAIHAHVARALYATRLFNVTVTNVLGRLRFHDDNNRVRARGEVWQAESKVPVTSGEPVRVLAGKGRVLHGDPITPPKARSGGPGGACNGCVQPVSQQRGLVDERARRLDAPVFVHRFTGWPCAGLLHACFPDALFIEVVTDNVGLGASGETVVTRLLNDRTALVIAPCLLALATTLCLLVVSQDDPDGAHGRTE